MNDSKRLGRKLSIDLRDNNYLLPDLRRSGILETKRLWSPGPRLDQGRTSSCVGHGIHKLLTMGPVTNKPKLTPIQIYERAQEIDEWEGSDYDGTSVRAGLDVGREMGMIASYQWALSVEIAVPWLLTKGPLVTGTIWPDSMFDPWTTWCTRKGYKGRNQYTFINVDKNSQFDYAGGHCYVINGVDKLLQCPDGSTGALRILNSWGASWADKGEAWISFADFTLLMRYYGEMATVVEI